MRKDHRVCVMEIVPVTITRLGIQQTSLSQLAGPVDFVALIGILLRTGSYLHHSVRGGSWAIGLGLVVFVRFEGHVRIL